MIVSKRDLAMPNEEASTSQSQRKFGRKQKAANRKELATEPLRPVWRRMNSSDALGQPPICNSADQNEEAGKP